MTIGRSEASRSGDEPTALVANLPYNVAVPVLLHLLEAIPSLRHGLVMVQAEVADRLAADPGSQRLRHPVGEGGLVRRCAPAGPGAALRVLAGAARRLRLVASTRGRRRLRGATREEVFAVVDAAFGQRRKTLRAALAGWAGSPAAAEAALRAAGIDPGARG